MNITDNNLNLLSYFVVVSEERNLSRAARRLHLSQPALSHALARMRVEFSDPLFVRVPHGLVPTPRANVLLPQVRHVLAEAAQLYSKEVDLSKISRPVTISTTTYFELRILDNLLTALKLQAPGVVLHTRSLIGEFPKAALEDGEVDVAVAAYFSELPQGFRMKNLGSDPFACVVRKKHPYLKGRQTLKDYLALQHVKIDIPPGANQPIDDFVQSTMGLRREVTVHLSNFLTPPWILARTDLILTCPRTLAENYANAFDLTVVDLPAKVAPIDIKMVWHERNHSDPLHLWLRSCIVKALGA